MEERRERAQERIKDSDMLERELFAWSGSAKILSCVFPGLKLWSIPPKDDNFLCRVHLVRKIEFLLNVDFYLLSMLNSFSDRTYVLCDYFMILTLWITLYDCFKSSLYCAILLGRFCDFNSYNTTCWLWTANFILR